jgi:predicted signal transduction protein with EAL and GGDEF domain
VSGIAKALRDAAGVVTHYVVSMVDITERKLAESVLVSDVAKTIDKMLALKAHGVGFSLDDFGTGYSSLAFLKLLPLDQLKIDQSFVRDILVDRNDAAIAFETLVASRQLLLADSG